jgi:Tol biopolymer transport system component
MRTKHLISLAAALLLAAPAAAHASGPIIYERGGDLTHLWSTLPSGDITSCGSCLTEGAEVHGDRVYFDSDMVPPIHVFSSRLDGSDVRQETFTPGFQGYPTISPDGSKVAYDGQDDDFGTTQGIYVAPLDRSAPPRRVEAPPANSGAIDGNPVWSPDGRTIAFQRIRLNGCGWHCRARFAAGFKSVIYLMNPDGSNVRRLTPSDGHGWADASWAPDSRSLIVQSYDDHGTRNGISSDEYRINADGSGLVAITNSRQGQFWFSGDYSPDGRRIAVMHLQPGGPPDVVDMAADGSDPQVVASCDVWCDHPNW